MTAGKFVLDTNILIASFAADAAVNAELAAGHVALILAIVAGELFYWAKKSARSIQNLSKLETFIASAATLDVDLETSRCFGKIKQGLLKKGRPIPENDMWIAATAIRHGLPLVTRDIHFASIDGLNVVKW